MSCENKTVTIDGIEYELVKKAIEIRLNSVNLPGSTAIVSDRAMTWSEAKEFAIKQDSRLPSIADLHGYRKQLKQLLGDKANNYFWTSEEHSNNTTLAWLVNLGNGYTNINTTTYSYYVVCIRD